MISKKLQKGADAAVFQCLEVKKKDRVVIIFDNSTSEIEKALGKSVNKAGAVYKSFKIEDHLKRPAKSLPQNFLNLITEFKPNVSIYCATGMDGELPVFRSPLINYLYKNLNCRHAHMINATVALVEDGLNKDYDLVYRVTNRVCNIMKTSQKLKATDPHGTDIEFDLDNENLNWVPSHGKIKKGKPWQNLPSGETFTAPQNVNGVLAAWVLGDNLSEKYGVLDSPMMVTVKEGYVHDVYAADKSDKKTLSAVKDFKKYIKKHPMGDRVGELGIGTLVGLKGFVGNLLQDEKFPGLHMAFGHPYPDETGAKWDAPSHIDIIAKNVTLTAVKKGKERLLMKNGKYLKDILE